MIVLLDVRETELAEVRTRLEQLRDIRQNVDSFGLTVPEMAGFYTDTINLLIDISHPITSLSASSEVLAMQTARALIGAAKEAAGLERAMGATGLSGGFASPVFNRFLRLNGAQSALLYEATNSLSDPNWLVSLQQSTQFMDIQAARQRIEMGASTNVFDDLTAGQWFAISTAWIDLLRQEELKIVAAVKEKTSVLETNAKEAFVTLAVIGSIVSVVVLVFAVFTDPISSILKRSQRSPKAMFF